MDNKLEKFISYNGEIGRDDYFKASIILTLALFILIALVAFSATAVGISLDGLLENIWLRFLLIGFAIRFTWPIQVKRWRDLGPKLSKYWLGVVMAFTVLPDYKEISDPGLSVLIGVITLLSLYPYCKLIFVPGRKHAKLKSQAEQ